MSVCAQNCENQLKNIINKPLKLKVTIQPLEEFYHIIYKLKQTAAIQLVTFNFNSKGFSITLPTMTEQSCLDGFGDMFNVGKDEFCAQLDCDEEITFKLALPELDCLIYYGLKTDNTMNITMIKGADDMIINFPSINETNIIYAR